ncbi:hypothetical protein [Sphingomonas sp. Ag1]|uniref:hypothetical protein n=1 Tax=Sphingomonas sp. Ag1 TaxID=1642949 RepID=UPI0006237959|nr:hypothetical protein [Sphingomonas sp. Ag1]
MAPDQSHTELSEILQAVDEVERWSAHVQRFAYERVGSDLDASPHQLAAAAQKLVALVKEAIVHG